MQLQRQLPPALRLGAVAAGAVLWAAIPAGAQLSYSATVEASVADPELGTPVFGLLDFDTT